MYFKLDERPLRHTQMRKKNTRSNDVTNVFCVRCIEFVFLSFPILAKSIALRLFSKSVFLSTQRFFGKNGLRKTFLSYIESQTK